MFVDNPFAELSQFVPPSVMQWYVLIMILFVAGGTIYDILHKGSAKYFFDAWEKSQKKGERTVGTGEVTSLAVQTAVSEVLTSSEFCNPQRRAAHLLTMYGFLLYVITTVIMVFSYPTSATPTPTILPALWTIGALMVCIGGYWFWFFIRVDVAAEGNSVFRFMHADSVHRLAARQYDDGTDLGLSAVDRQFLDRDCAGALSDRDDGAVRLGALVQVLPHVLQAGGRASEAGR